VRALFPGSFAAAAHPILEVSSFDVDVPDDVAYLFSDGNRSLIAVDMLSGDRVVLER